VRKLVDEFRGFVLGGNLIALAIAFVIGAAFAALVSALVADLITPLVAAIFGKPDFGDLTFSINGSRFRYGDFINALLTFLTVAAAIFFFVLKPSQRLGLVPPSPAMRACPRCTTSIPEAATRCPQCTADIA
jgi:large conductance mechanosensitive channel